MGASFVLLSLYGGQCDLVSVIRDVPSMLCFYCLPNPFLIVFDFDKPSHDECFEDSRLMLSEFVYQPSDSLLVLPKT